MIFIRGFPLEKAPPNLSGKQLEIYAELQKSESPHLYYSLEELAFELSLRRNIIEAAINLSKSNAEFNIFQYSKFNPLYWTKTSRGYALKHFVQPSTAVEDVFKNGKEYAFECSTAIVLIYYYAVLQSIKAENFNRLFRNLLVWDWSYDKDLGITTLAGTEFIPGDVLYFHNPDFKHPVWIGENVVYLGKNQYFGHGIGIGTKEEMISALNSLRKSGAKRSAYLLPQFSRLNFRYLFQFSA
jgi:protein-glutamine gamma-glutamyltransferase